LNTVGLEEEQKMAPPWPAVPVEFDRKVLSDTVGLEEDSQAMAPPRVDKFDSKVLLDTLGLEESQQMAPPQLV
jgi:hypothetical protein